LTAQMWPAHPEEYLAVRADWVDQHPQATLALLQAVMAAQQWCDDPANRQELASILAGRNYFNVPVACREIRPGGWTAGGQRLAKGPPVLERPQGQPVLSLQEP
ncbi:MAG: ABC transporter substrate-binding protein, partial [Gloeomargarita sp. GMQP_bins_25]